MKSWQQIDGYFDFQHLYDKVLNELAVGFGGRPIICVEVGCWLGRSLAYLMQKAQEINKHSLTIAVDTWQGSHGADKESDAIHRAVLEANHGDIFNVFLQNMYDCGLLDGRGKLVPLRMNSWQAAACVGDRSIDFVCIDAAHNFDSVYMDCMSWWPKLRNGGIIAGDDYHDKQWPGVTDAVDKFFPSLGVEVEDVRGNHNCWLARKVTMYGEG